MLAVDQSASYRWCNHVYGRSICTFRTAHFESSTFLCHAFESLLAVSIHSTSVSMEDANADPAPDCDELEVSDVLGLVA